MPHIDLNADCGESFGRWQLGDDENIVKHVSSVNIACGFHAGDPTTMRRTVQLAARQGVNIGAHPGLPDLLGFGRRRIDADRGALIDYCCYQIGALAGIAADEGARLSYVKPHGALYGMVYSDPELALALAAAAERIVPGCQFMVLAGSPAATALRSAGFATLEEGFADIDYDDAGNLIIERDQKNFAAPKDPEEVAARAVEIAAGAITTVGGLSIPTRVDSVCIHGDRPNSVEVAAAVARALARSGYELRLSAIEA